jgi:hypothetical protein
MHEEEEAAAEQEEADTKEAQAQAKEVAASKGGGDLRCGYTRYICRFALALNLLM